MAASVLPTVMKGMIEPLGSISRVEDSDYDEGGSLGENRDDNRNGESPSQLEKSPVQTRAGSVASVSSGAIINDLR